MLSFENDYAEGAHPALLSRLTETNFEQLPGYGTDPYCKSAAEKIRAACAAPDAQVFFISGGTQTNAVVIRTMLRQYEGVVSALTGHVNQHEAGAIEFTGHKVLPIPQHDGRIDAGELRDYLRAFWADGSHEHMVFPGMVYVSHPTEYGTLYSRAELSAIAQVCREYEIPLYLDGARLGYGLMAPGSDLTLEDISGLCDVFYIGGTKVGALCGEAVVFPKGNAPEYFMTMVKQHGAMLAKGRLLGVQFDALFTDGLYFDISRHAIDMAGRLRNIFAERGFSFLLDSPTNQQFVVMEDALMEKLAQRVRFCPWERVDGTHSAVRFASSWATRPEALSELENILDELS
ncbi:MAG: threonine aldolase family protein [Candidatus Heteroscillospira sp.]